MTVIRNKKFGQGGQAPVGGVWVESKLGDEVFYKGGQYLPEGMSNKPIPDPNKPKRSRGRSVVKFTKTEEDKLAREMASLDARIQEARSLGYALELSTREPGWNSFHGCQTPGNVTLKAIKDKTDWVIMLQVMLTDTEKIQYLESLISDRL